MKQRRKDGMGEQAGKGTGVGWKFPRSPPTSTPPPLLLATSVLTRLGEAFYLLLPHFTGLPPTPAVSSHPFRFYPSAVRRALWQAWGVPTRNRLGRSRPTVSGAQNIFVGPHFLARGSRRLEKQRWDQLPVPDSSRKLQRRLRRLLDFVRQVEKWKWKLCVCVWAVACACVSVCVCERVRERTQPLSARGIFLRP